MVFVEIGKVWRGGKGEGELREVLSSGALSGHVIVGNVVASFCSVNIQEPATLCEKSYKDCVCEACEVQLAVQPISSQVSPK